MPWLIVSRVIVRAWPVSRLRRFCCSHSTPIAQIASVVAISPSTTRVRSDQYGSKIALASSPTMTISG